MMTSEDSILLLTPKCNACVCVCVCVHLARQMAAVVQWHRETIGMAALYEIPHQMTNTPRNDPAKSPFLVRSPDASTRKAEFCRV